MKGKNFFNASRNKASMANYVKIIRFHNFNFKFLKIM